MCVKDKHGGGEPSRETKRQKVQAKNDAERRMWTLVVGALSEVRKGSRHEGGELRKMDS